VSASARERVIVALDQPDAAAALACARALRGRLRWVKVGMTLYYAEGPAIIAAIRGLGFDVFLDLKLHDIPHQVERAARVLGALGAGMLTVHASGGEAMIRAAVDGAAEGASSAGVACPEVLAVTVLTSLDARMMESLGVCRGLDEQVDALARLASSAGAGGVVCSPHEAAAMRSVLGARALIVTPGVRPGDGDHGDQARVARPAAALAAGASHVVIGRPVTETSDPALALERIIEQIESAGQDA
jgi:orotidine-5'-phosphate decarboxylase